MHVERGMGLTFFGRGVQAHRRVYAFPFIQSQPYFYL